MAEVSNDIGTYVKLGNGRGIDLSQGFVEPVKGLFVREAFAGVVKQVEQSTGGVLGKGTKYVKPSSTKSLATYDVALLVRALGTSGQMIRATTFNKQEIVEYYNYVRPTAKYAGTVMSAVAVAKELSAKGVPWTALAIVYPTAGTKLKKPMVLHVKGIRAYYRAIHTKAGTKYVPEVLLYFTRQVLGLRKRTPYLFDLIIMYASKQVQRAVTRKELVEKAMEQTPPPQVVLAPSQPRAQPRQKAKATRTVANAEPQPTAVTVATPQVEVVPQQQPTSVVTQQQPKAVPAQPQPKAPAQPSQAPQAVPASISTGNYVKQDLSFVKEIVSSEPGEAFRAIRERSKKKYVSGV